MASVGNLNGLKSAHTHHNSTTGAGVGRRRKMDSTHSIAELRVPLKEEGNVVKSHSTSTGRGPWFLVMCFCGIFISYFIYGLAQEKITKRKFDDEYFRFFMFLVLVQCIVNALFARTVCAMWRSEVSLQPHFLFSFLGFTYVGAMVASNTALSFITYPTQVLGKSAKPIPILILGVILGGKHYPRIKYFIVFLIVVGVALFFYKDGGTDQGSGDKLFNMIGFGEFLIIVSLLLDGLTGILQDRLRSDHSVIAHHMMYAVNVFAAVYLSVGVVVTGELWRVMAFIQRHPTVIFNISVFTVSSAIGQNFIFLTITNFGPLTTSIITTTRKFFTILASVLLFGNPIFPRQWVGVVMVFIGLGLDAYFGKSSKPV